MSKLMYKYNHRIELLTMKPLNYFQKEKTRRRRVSKSLLLPYLVVIFSYIFCFNTTPFDFVLVAFAFDLRRETIGELIGALLHHQRHLYNHSRYIIECLER